MHATVQVWGYREPEIDRTLKKIIDQRVPEPWTFHVEAWVTEWVDPNCGHCTTKAAANSVEAVEVFDAPEGKLSARNAAHANALSSESDVIVSWDGDAPPLGDGALGRLLEPYDDSDVVATSGQSRRPNPGMFNAVMSALSFADWLVFQPIYGRFSSFTPRAWEAAGPFNTDLDETDIRAVRQEEEMDFRRRLRKIGRVKDVFDAQVFLETRRHECKLNPFIDNDYCDRLGTETFTPRRPEK